MLPTTYRGDATIDGEHLSAELRLDENHVRLITGRHAELLSWPLASVSVEAGPSGAYRLNAGADSFEFSPLVDDGLGDEIALRTRFASIVDPPQQVGESAAFISDRVKAAGKRKTPGNQRRPSVLTGGDLAVRTALVVLGVLAVVVVTVAVVSGAFESQPATVVVETPAGGDSPASTLPFTEGAPNTSVPDPQPTTPPDTAPPATAPPATAPPVTTPPATTATTAPPTSAPPVSILPALDLTPEQFRAQWDTIAAGLDGELTVDSFTTDEATFSMDVTDFVGVTGVRATDGTVSSIQLVGDPSGTVTDDRLVITAMGISVALAAPDLDPAGRRSLLDALGFDVDSPSLAGLDGVLTYRGYEYRLKWDDGARLVIFDVGEIGNADTAES